MKDAGNIEWDRIPGDWTVVDKGGSYIATRGDEFKLIYWSSLTAHAADEYLQKRIRKQNALTRKQK